MIEKDYQIEVQRQLSPDWNIPTNAVWEEWMKALAARVNQLIGTDFPALVQLLYRMDVSESKLKALLAEKPGKDAGTMIAGLLVERQLQKIRSRRQFRSPNDIPDDEKW